MTHDQFTLMQDKIALWRRASVEGSMELRDYNGRAAEALTTALVERAELLAELKWCMIGAGRRDKIAAAIATAEGQS